MRSGMTFTECHTAGKIVIVFKAVYFFSAGRYYYHDLNSKEIFYTMKATGIVRRIDDLGRVVIPKEIRRTMRIREGDPLDNSLTLEEKFAIAVHGILKRYKEKAR